jgi:hypothetical protein
MEDLKEILMDIADGLESIREEFSEMNSNIQTIGSMLTLNLLINHRPDLREKISPLMDELAKGVDFAMSDLDEEDFDEEDLDKEEIEK